MFDPCYLGLTTILDPRAFSLATMFGARPKRELVWLQTQALGSCMVARPKLYGSGNPVQVDFGPRHNPL